jgi:hypothetical protein
MLKLLLFGGEQLLNVAGIEAMFLAQQRLFPALHASRYRRCQPCQILVAHLFPHLLQYEDQASKQSSLISPRLHRQMMSKTHLMHPILTQAPDLVLRYDVQLQQPPWIEDFIQGQLPKIILNFVEQMVERSTPMKVTLIIGYRLLLLTLESPFHLCPSIFKGHFWLKLRLLLYSARIHTELQV